ncbi:MAG TPA: hypothetical protein P5060_03540 [Candidatus Absconditabacterales bacterium]|nr:hypothetical protein [Candidatus Absconditabacterales bacterium]
MNEENIRLNTNGDEIFENISAIGIGSGGLTIIDELKLNQKKSNGGELEHILHLDYESNLEDIIKGKDLNNTDIIYAIGDLREKEFKNKFDSIVDKLKEYNILVIGIVIDPNKDEENKLPLNGTVLRIPVGSEEVIYKSIYGISNILLRVSDIHVTLEDIIMFFQNTKDIAIGFGNADDKNKYITGSEKAMEDFSKYYKLTEYKKILLNYTTCDTFGDKENKILHGIQKSANFIEKLLSDDITFMQTMSYNNSYKDNIDVMILGVK